MAEALGALDALDMETPARTPKPNQAGRPVPVLTQRERDVALLISRGLTNREIATELTIAVGTANRHVANILTKLGFRKRLEIAGWVNAQAANV